MTLEGSKKTSSENGIIPTYRQFRAARELLGWKQEDLAKHAGVGRSTVETFEQGKTVPHLSTIIKLREACELRGIVFTNGNNPTVSLQSGKAKLPP